MSAEGESFGCAVGQRAISVSYLYAVGSVVYVVSEAKGGVLEAVKIKEVLLNKTPYGQIVPIYKDFNNRLYNESMLCSDATATALAVAYLEARQQAILDALAECSET